MPTPSHVYSDKSAGFFRYRQSDSVHSHIQRVHVSTATVDNVTDPGSPSDQDHLIHPEADVNATVRNFFTLVSGLISTTYTLSVIDFQPVSGGLPVGAPVPLQPYTVAGAAAGSGIPEAQVTLTFRDSEGAPCSVRWFDADATWTPSTKPALVPAWGGITMTALVAYLIGLARTGSPAYPANMTNIVSHNGKPFAVPLFRVSCLNNRLRREYRVK